MSISPQAKNGMENGLRLLVDAETFDYSYFPRGSEGFDVAMADSRDRAVVRQQGEYTVPNLTHRHVNLHGLCLTIRDCYLTHRHVNLHGLCLTIRLVLDFYVSNGHVSYVKGKFVLGHMQIF